MEHFRNIRQNDNTHRVGCHFISNYHNRLNDISDYIFDFIYAHPDIAMLAEVED